MARHFTEDPIDRFNRMMGGRSTMRRPARSYASSVPSRGTRRSIRQGSRGTVPSGTTKAYQRATHSPRGTSISTPSGARSAFESIYNDLTTKYQQTASAQEAINRVNQDKEDANNDGNWLQDAWNAVGIPDIISAASHSAGSPVNFQQQLVGRAGDLLSRPFYGVAGGLTNILGQTGHRGFSGGDVGFTLGNFLSGFGHGLTGEERHGGGDVYEAFKSNPEIDIAQPLRNLEEAHPRLEEHLSRLAGFGLEMGLDPLNYVAPAAPEILRGGEEAGRVLTRETAQRTLEQVAREEATSLIHNSGQLGPHLANDPQRLIDSVTSAVLDKYGRSTAEVLSGGAPGVRTLNDRYWPSVAAHSGRAAAEDSLTGYLRKVVDGITSGTTRSGYAVDWYARRSADVKEFMTELTAKLLKDGHITAGATTDDILSLFRQGVVDQTYVQDIMTNVMGKYGPELDNLQMNIARRTTNPSYRTIGIRVGRREIPVRTFGRAYDYVNTRAGRFLPDIGNHLFEGKFPGMLSNTFTTARAEAFKPVEQFEREMFNLVRGLDPQGINKWSDPFTHEENELLQKFMELPGQSSGNAKVDRMRDYFRREGYDRIYNEGRLGGTRGDGSIYQPDFVHQHLRGGTADQRRDFNADRSKSFKNMTGSGAYDQAAAVSAGLKPEKGGFENLLIAYKQHRRDMAMANFRNELVELYGIERAAPLSVGDARRAGLIEVKPENLNENFRRMTTTKGSTFYLPQQMNDVVDLFKKITSWNTAEYDKFGRTYADIIKKMKVAMTLPYPGFHLKNLMGDVAMGLLDDINPNDYARVMKKYMQNRKGSRAVFEIIPGMDKTFDEMFGLFERNSAGGFFGSDGNFVRTRTAGSIPRNFVQDTYAVARKASDVREQMPRFVHFQTAFQDEAKALYKSGVRDLAEIEERATRAAIWRVNYYKFDYNALMPFEGKLKSLAFPFYTYMRKAIPTLMMQMYNNPKYFALLNRYLQYNDGSAADGFNKMNMPGWIQEMGAAVLNDGPSPDVLTSDILPYGALDTMNSMLNPREFLRKGLSNLNPILQFPIEAATNQSLYEDKPLNKNLWDQFTGNIPLASTINREVAHIPGFEASPTSQLYDDLTGGNFWDINRLNNRLTGLGLPFHNVSQQQQMQQFNENKDAAIDDPITQFNRSQDRYTITADDQFNFTVHDRIGNLDVSRPFDTPQAAIQWAENNLPGINYQRPFVSPLQPVRQEDVNMLMGR